MVKCGEKLYVCFLCDLLSVVLSVSVILETCSLLLIEISNDINADKVQEENALGLFSCRITVKRFIVLCEFMSR